MAGRAFPAAPWSWVVGQPRRRGRQNRVTSTATGRYPPCACGHQRPSASTAAAQRPSSWPLAQSPCPSAAHARRTARSGNPHAARPGRTAPRAASSRPLASIHRRCNRPRFVPTGHASTSVQSNVSMR